MKLEMRSYIKHEEKSKIKMQKSKLQIKIQKWRKVSLRGEKRLRSTKC